MTDPNQSMPPPGARTHEGYLPCPKCGSTFCKRQGFTWWGGVIGAKILHHVRCDACGATYHGKTGASNNGAIAVYMGVVGLITLAIMLLLFRSL